MKMCSSHRLSIWSEGCIIMEKREMKKLEPLFPLENLFRHSKPLKNGYNLMDDKKTWDNKSRRPQRK